MNDDKNIKICSAKYKAQEISDKLNLYYWTESNYHLKRAIEILDELNKINLEALCQKNITKND